MSGPENGSPPLASAGGLERRYGNLLEAAPDGILEVDEDGVIVLSNALAARMFGYQVGELIGQPVDTLMPLRYRAAHADHRKRYCAEPRTRPISSGLALAGLRKDGTEFPVEISLSPVALDGGMRVIAVVRDVTERQQAEAQVRAVHERYAAELAAKNQELALRNQAVERANRLKTEFLASMSHELRTPLHTVIGFSDLLLEEAEGPLGEKQKRFLGHIRQDAQHLLEIINDILDLSKIEAGRLDLRPEEFALEPAVEEVLSSIRLSAAEKDLLLESRLPAATVLHADRLRFKEILFNLLSNAVKFTPAHGRIGIVCEVDGDALLTTVWDTGVGIPVEEQAAIFDMFHQVGPTTKGVREGTGLGLAITKRLVELHRGSVSVQSKPGQGSTFVVHLPLRCQSAAR